jgi:hypothetical protein
MRVVSASSTLVNALGGVCLAALLATSVFAQTAGRTSPIEVSGFQVDTSRASKAGVKQTLATLRHQIAIVQSAGLSPQILSFFHSIPISIDPSLTGMNGQYAQVSGKWLIRARVGRWPPDRAILLHELLHAYHHQVLGQPTPAIVRAFEEAREAGIYPPEYQEAYFLTNPKEYFAVIAEIYLSGRAFRPPFNCGNVQKVQPRFIAYMAELFGERACTLERNMPDEVRK